MWVSYIGIMSAYRPAVLTWNRTRADAERSNTSFPFERIRWARSGEASFRTTTSTSDRRSADPRSPMSFSLYRSE